MEQQKIIASAETTIHASPERLWKALTDPEEIKEYMMGTQVRTEWEVGGDIIWAGEWEGKSYEDKGKIKTFNENRELAYTHYSAMSGREDTPENYHTVTVTLEPADEQTKITLTQDGNANEKEKEHSAKNWQGMLEGLKKLVEGKG